MSKEQYIREIEEMLLPFLNSSPAYSVVRAQYFMPYSTGYGLQGIECICPKECSQQAEDIMGFLDIPTMMSGLELRVVQAQSNGSWHIFIYDGEKLHEDNIKKLNVLGAGEIFPHKDEPNKENEDDEEDW